ncbi:MAG: hypothetical protein II773_12925 [Oscillospiraceae bacterium]|nr:hypothetical protein [Oscillospiraceae bacterium]MBQ4312482.1 hypothetical protein [Oscillospiraceae bacterium]MCR5166190.1 hypothetical protein [Oscillospiraceae bacterium]
MSKKKHDSERKKPFEDGSIYAGNAVTDNTTDSDGSVRLAHVTDAEDARRTSQDLKL